MTIRDEINTINKEAEAASETMTAERVVESARNAERFPLLNEHLWKVPETELAAEARIARAHKLIIRLTVTTDDGNNVRSFLHTRSEKGYRPLGTVAGSVNLASIKLQELTADIGRARQRLNAFRSVLPETVADEIDEALAQATARIEAAQAASGAAA
jgi:hypothetical protein